MRATKDSFFVFTCTFMLFGYFVCVSALKVTLVVRVGSENRETTRPLQHVGARIKALSETRVSLSIRLPS